MEKEYVVGRANLPKLITNLLTLYIVHDKEQHHLGLASLQIKNSNNADVLLDSGLNLFDIIANLCSKLYYILWSATEVRKLYCETIEVNSCV